LPERLEGIANPSQLCQVLTARGNLELYRGHPREALGWYLDALRLAELRAGEEPTRVATLHISVALAQSDLEQGEEALAHLGTALELRQRIFGPGHPELLAVLANRAAVLFQLGRWAESEADSLAAEAIAARVSPDHPVLAMARSNRAEALEKQGRVDEAIALHLATLEQERRQKGEEHEGAVISHMNVASLLTQRRRYTEAASHGHRAVAIGDRVLPADHPYRANARITLAQVEVSRGRRQDALGPLRAALEILGDRPDVASLRAEARFLLAQILADQPAGRTEARRLAEQAAAELHATRKAERAHEVDAWLAKQPAKQPP
jgi:tetratricopeptide (TPR) repeat protein